MKNKIKYVLSNKWLHSKKDAEESLTRRLEGGENLQNYKLFKVLKTYKPVIKFKELK